MNPAPRVTLRPVEPADLDCFFSQQLDPEANRMAAFVGKDPANRAAFDAHWARLLSSGEITMRTIVAGGRIVGHVSCFPEDGHLEVTYWLGREFWGRGYATRALEQLLQLVVVRPMFARAAADNLGSLRVLQKCGFAIVGTNTDFAPGRDEDTKEYILRLDLAVPTTSASGRR